MLRFAHPHIYSLEFNTAIPHTNTHTHTHSLVKIKIHIQIKLFENCISLCALSSVCPRGMENHCHNCWIDLGIGAH